MSLVQTIYCKFIYIILNIYMIVTFCFSFFYQVSVKIWLIEKSPHLVMQKIEPLGLLRPGLDEMVVVL